jgi:hypothetical protein
MRSLSLTLALAAIVTVVSAPIHAAEAAAKPAAQSAQAAPAQPAAEGVNVVPAPAVAGKKTCDDVKAGIEAKIKARGVKAFSLDIVGKDEAKDAKVVGNCEGGKKVITYKRG